MIVLQHAKDYDQMSKIAYQTMREVLINNPNAVLGLATGSTPIGLYKEMIKDYEAGNVSYKNMVSINLDEYVGLPVEHPESYRSFMNRNLFDHIDINKANTHVPNGLATDVDQACADYTAFAKAHPIDVQILGIGGNGHIGFNEPGTPFSSNTHKVELKENTRKDNARFFDDDLSKVPTHAITLGLQDIMQAKLIILLASGAGKAQAIKDMILGPISPDCPASILQTHPNVIVIADEAASYYIKA
ncbi:MAG: glucosamine-6-phosphate deaminase [Clostridia bacterium]|nr:glucosamine-6-phosphate deaminase [Clostridia bacterium]MBO7155921.1 glucosamine-6-phosphate deaminase [Clostridia bacterium]